MAENTSKSRYKPIRAETSTANTGSLRYSIPDIPVAWDLDDSGGRVDFYAVAISSDGRIVENLSSSYLSFDNAASTLTVAPVFGQKDFCVYVFRNEEAANNFALKSDGNASLTSILAQFEKDNRVLAQLQALQNRNLRSPDECATLPDAKFRKGKLLSFDSNGQPVCSIVAYTKEEILAAAKPYVDSAAASAKSAGEAATLAGDYAAQATTAATTATAKADAASASATAASNAQAAAEQARTDASAISDEASVWMSNAQEAAQAAATSSSQADAFQAAAASSATQAGASAKNAADSATQAGDYAVQATNSQTAAAQSATTAGVMADAAEAYAVQAESANTSATEKAGAAASSATAAQQAAAQATEISDPEGWRTNTRAMISDLAASKVNIGTFQFGAAGGALQTAGNPMYGVVDRTYCMSLELDEDWNLNATSGLWINLAADGVRASSLVYGGVWCQLARGSDGLNYLQIIYGDGTNTYVNAFGTKVNVETIFGGTNSTIPAGKYAVCICIHFGEGTSADPSKAYVYVNNVLKSTISGYSTTKKTNIAWVAGGKLGFFDIGNSRSVDATSFSRYVHFEGKASRLAVFNFDMSATDAPYTPSDYASGKKIPLALCSSTASKRCILAAADYAIARNSTTRLVKDVSGNGNDLTVCGDVVGDKDAAVAAFIDELKTQISQTTTNS